MLARTFPLWPEAHPDRGVNGVHNDGRSLDQRWLPYALCAKRSCWIEATGDHNLDLRQSAAPVNTKHNEQTA